ncbi:MAG: DUF1232 domain-containing protein [Chlorobiaceae bacterium]|nr:DUF1232 domain-containing protein [Chlorobiaceae bacterium]
MKALDNAIGHAAASAVSLLKDRKKSLKLLDAVIRRINGKQRLFDTKELTASVQAAVRLVRTTVRREYPDVPWRSIVLITAGLIYFVSPADAIPDILPMLGLTDDAAILTAIFASVSSDLDAFLEWEKSRVSRP